MTRFRTGVLLAAGIGTHACRTPEQGPGNAIDSAGVLIVTALSEDTPAPWRLVHARRLGASDSTHPLNLIRSPQLVAADLNGRVFAYDEVSERVEIFDSSGTLIGTRGRRGGGPGEYQYPGWVNVEADGSLLVVDMGKLAGIRFDSEGHVLLQRTLRGIGYPLGGVRFWSDTTIVGTRDFDTNLRPVHTLRLIGPGIDTILATLAPPTLGQAHFRCPGATLSINGSELLFAPKLQWAVGGRTIAAAVQDRYEVRFFERTRLHRIVRRQVGSIQALPAHVARLYPEGLLLGPGTSCRKQPEELVTQFGLSPTLPALGRLAFAPDGALWVERYRLPGDVPMMDILSPSGEYLGTLTGAGFPVGFASDGRFVGLVPDPESGGYQVFLYQLDPRPW